jgi:riboflavin biosynthesis pyrimidine reductase
MASLVLKMSASLDGYVAPPDGSTDWVAAGRSPYLLAHGGVRFARSLVETGLIDEYRLVVHPVVLGAGERLRRSEAPARGASAW